MSLRRAASLCAGLLNVIRKRPVLAIFDVTKHCNQYCPMCNIPDNHAEDMSLDQIKELAAKLRKFGICYVFIQGGEPLIRDDTVDIVDIFISKGIKPTVITNGVLLNKSLSAQLVKRKCNVVISLDSFDEKNYLFLRGSDKFNTVIENIRYAAALSGRKGNWSVTSTVSKKSDINDIVKIYEFSQSLGLMFAIRPYVFVLGTAGRYCEDLSYSESDVIEIFRFFREKAKKENYLASLVYDYHIKYICGEKMPECDAMKYSFLVRENGKIAPCIEFPGKEVCFDSFREYKKKYSSMLCECNNDHPCFYNDAREIGILLRSAQKIILHAPQIIKQMIRFGNFF